MHAAKKKRKRRRRRSSKLSFDCLAALSGSIIKGEKRIAIRFVYPIKAPKCELRHDQQLSNFRKKKL
jgi:hypothetical protein